MSNAAATRGLHQSVVAMCREARGLFTPSRLTASRQPGCRRLEDADVTAKSGIVKKMAAQQMRLEPSGAFAYVSRIAAETSEADRC